MKRNRKRTARKGFTLIEILLVIGIIAMLAAFVVPQFMNVQSDAERKATMTLVGPKGELATQIELFRVAMGRFPEELSELVEPPDDSEEAEKWAGPYIRDAESLKDSWGRDLEYKAPGDVNERSYDLWSVGPDGEDGSDDDITNWKKE